MNLYQKAIQSAQQSEISFSKFITPNDTGKTGGHQYGYHLHKTAWRLFFNSPGIKGLNKDTFIRVKWQDDFETTSRFIYYGVGTRNEYRLTRFGKGFPFLNDENVGDLLIISKIKDDYYVAYVLSKDEEIDEFFSALNITPLDTNGLIPRQLKLSFEDKLIQCYNKYIESLKVDFPPTIDLAVNARNCFMKTNNLTSKKIVSDPDKIILDWLNSEFDLFKILENNRYNKIIKNPFNSVEDLVLTANTILNRRKSRAGKSLEHHLEEIFRTYTLTYQTQVITENNKKPDFIFPDIDSYNNPKFDRNKLTFLAAKTTCKDRWIQILNEADRIETKHLFTLQQSISKNQLDEMYRYKVCLVIPNAYHQSFPKEYRNKILTLKSFIDFVSSKQNK